uniref:Uncharacterized protein n=1 Tax=Rhizophora mucronata TaxID=61149 RepID=A0A2P2P0Q0_RHIMU
MWIQSQTAEDYSIGQKPGDTKILAFHIPTLKQEDHKLVANVKTLIEIQISDSSQGFYDINQDDAKVNENKNCIITEACELI